MCVCIWPTGSRSQSRSVNSCPKLLSDLSGTEDITLQQVHRYIPTVYGPLRKVVWLPGAAEGALGPELPEKLEVELGEWAEWGKALPIGTFQSHVVLRYLGRPVEAHAIQSAVSLAPPPLHSQERQGLFSAARGDVPCPAPFGL